MSIPCLPSLNLRKAAKPCAPQLCDSITQQCGSGFFTLATPQVEAAFASAAHVTKLDIVNTRVASFCDGAAGPGLASYDKGGERYRFQVPTQGVAGNDDPRQIPAHVRIKKEVHLLTANSVAPSHEELTIPISLLLHAAKALGRG